MHVSTVADSWRILGEHRPRPLRNFRSSTELDRELCARVVAGAWAFAGAQRPHRQFAGWLFGFVGTVRCHSVRHSSQFNRWVGAGALSRAPGGRRGNCGCRSTTAAAESSSDGRHSRAEHFCEPRAYQPASARLDGASGTQFVAPTTASFHVGPAAGAGGAAALQVAAPERSDVSGNGFEHHVGPDRQSLGFGR